LFGNIISTLDRNRYKVAWDDGTTSDCYSNSLSKEAAFASLPPDVQPHLAQDRLDLPPKVKKQWTMRWKPLPKMKGILKKRSTCQKLGGHPICQTLNPRRGMEVRCRKIILKEGCQGSCPQADYLSKKAQAVAHVDSF
jgi:hypothetical protein